MDVMYSFYVGLGTSVHSKRILEALNYLADLHGGSSYTLLRGAWKNPEGRLENEPSARFDIIQTSETSVDAEGIAQWLAELFEQREVLVTEQLLKSYSIVNPNQ